MPKLNARRISTQLSLLLTPLVVSCASLSTPSVSPPTVLECPRLESPQAGLMLAPRQPGSYSTDAQTSFRTWREMLTSSPPK